MALRPILRTHVNVSDSVTCFIDYGERGYMCPECFNITYINIDDRIIYDDSEGMRGKIPKRRITCSCCEYSEVVSNNELLDPNIAEAISWFNKADLETEHSCEGNNGDNMYISFKYDTIIKYSSCMPDELAIKVDRMYTNKPFSEYESSNIALRPLFYKPTDEFREKKLKEIEDWAKGIYYDRVEKQIISEK